LKQSRFYTRATDDIDKILIVEALSPEFVAKFWEFIVTKILCTTKKKTVKKETAVALLIQLMIIQNNLNYL
jgi:hypothetical protein